MFERFYSTSKGDNILKDLIKPELNGATEYWRSTGDFSSSFLISATEIFVDFFNHENNKMKVLCSIELFEEDCKAIGSSYKGQYDIETAILSELNSFEKMIKEVSIHRLKFLKEIITRKQFDIRLVTPKNGGVYHQKFGLFFRPDRNSYFIGGFNLSLSAHQFNSEICVPSIDQKKFNELEQLFELIWSGKSEDTVYKFPEACTKAIIRNIDEEIIRRPPQPPNPKKQSSYDRLWKHQKEAYQKFFENNCQGIVQMATGTGKTKLALAIYDELIDKNQIDNLVILTSSNPLLDQWEDEIRTTYPNVNIVSRHGSHNNISDLKPLLRLNKQIVVFSTYDQFLEINERLSQQQCARTFIVCDEVHNLGSETRISNLKGIFSMYPHRIGLSATPERMYDDSGTEFIQDELGKIVFRYELKDAINDGILCKFDYYPIFYELSADDEAKLKDLYKKLYLKENGKTVLNKQVANLIAEVYKGSENKLKPFESFILNNRDILKRCVIFVSTIEYGIKVADILHHARFNGVSVKYHTYVTGDDDQYLHDFSKKKLDCLITCDKISEGISINDISSIVLFSAARSDTETLQRIGRCLRKDKNDPGKKSIIVDFIIKDRLNEENTTDHDRYYQLSDLCDQVVQYEIK